MLIANPIIMALNCTMTNQNLINNLIFLQLMQNQLNLAQYAMTLLSLFLSNIFICDAEHYCYIYCNMIQTLIRNSYIVVLSLRSNLWIQQYLDDAVLLNFR